MIFLIFCRILSICWNFALRRVWLQLKVLRYSRIASLAGSRAVSKSIRLVKETKTPSYVWHLSNGMAKERPMEAATNMETRKRSINNLYNCPGEVWASTGWNNLWRGLIRMMNLQCYWTYYPTVAWFIDMNSYIIILSSAENIRTRIIKVNYRSRLTFFFGFFVFFLFFFLCFSRLCVLLE